MALQLSLPGHFNFKSPDSWAKWKRRFEHYRSASGLTDAAETRQVSTLLYCLGEEAEDILCSTSITVAEREVYKTVVNKFEGFFRVRKNLIFEWACFNRQDELERETAESYSTALYSLIQDSEYEAMQARAPQKLYCCWHQR